MKRLYIQMIRRDDMKGFFDWTRDNSIPVITKPIWKWDRGSGIFGSKRYIRMDRRRIPYQGSRIIIRECDYPFVALRFNIKVLDLVLSHGW